MSVIVSAAAAVVVGFQNLARGKRLSVYFAKI
jgi:hypothetical protein